MLYELVGIVRPGRIAEVKEIAKTAGNIVLRSGGVVRGFTNWGVFALPKPMRDTSSRATATTHSSSNKPTPSSSDPSPSFPPLTSQDAASIKRSEHQLRHPKHYSGHYFIMRFDSNGRTQHVVRRTMSLDPRLLRYSIVKMGNKLDEICDVGGQAEEWGNLQGAQGMKWSETTEGKGVGHDPYRIYFE